MNIVLTTPYYPPHVGGVEFHVKHLADRLSKRHNVRVLSSTGDCEVIRSINLPYSPIPINFPDKNELKADVYHSHIPSPFFAYRIYKLNLQPHIVTYHNDVVVPEVVDGVRIPGLISKSIENINRRIVRPILDSCSAIITTTFSYAITSELIRDYVDKVFVVPNGVDYERFSPGRSVDERESIVLYVGRLVEYKGVEKLLITMKSVQKEVNAKLVIIGDGEDRNKFESIAKKLGVETIFTGKLPDEKVIGWMKVARVLVLPSSSRLEAFGMVLLESMASGTPVIAGDIPGVRDVAKEGGMIFSDVDELRERILKLLTDDKFALKLSSKGLTAVRRKYGWDRVVEEVEKIYLQFI